ncbi:MAG: deoxyribodipyrimidine photo-lyase [Bacteroidales bacterium]|nr:deoxyribodipyrimidine photo-lyase [Bacteroidales bacterium]
MENNLTSVNIFWFRRDLSLEDNHGLLHALKSDLPVIGLFIFDIDILEELEPNDSRVSFIYDNLKSINNMLKKFGSALLIKNNTVENVFREITLKYHIKKVYANEDYESYAIARDKKIEQVLSENNISFNLYKNQVIFAKNDILKNDGKPYTVYTPYKNKWLQTIKSIDTQSFSSENFLGNFIKADFNFPELKEIGFTKPAFRVKAINWNSIKDYEKFRDFPASASGSNIGVHLRFGTVSVRKIVKIASKQNQVFLSELIWREFFMQILYHFPHVEKGAFKPAYNYIEWENNEKNFNRWCRGETGYPIVDAGMRELNTTGYMHNRVRMVCASFLVKHLLIDWRWGEAYFARLLLDYELASNNGNWQWAAGTGCDAAPYFRIFNPYAQQQKFDQKMTYIKRFIPEFDDKYTQNPIVEHKFARERCIKSYKKALDRQ